MNKCPFVCKYNSFEGCVRDKYNDICPICNNSAALSVEMGKSSEWISVKESEPKPWAEVLTFSVKHPDSGIRIMQGWAAIRKVTHWMPLPEPPKEVE